MFGLGNPAPHPGASLQQQPPPGAAPQPFQQGNPAPQRGASQQQLPSGASLPFQEGGHGGPGTGRPLMQHLGYQSGQQVYQTAPMHPQNGASNVGMYVHGSQRIIGSSQGPYYRPVQHNSQQHPQVGAHNLYHVPSPILSLPPPPPLPPASHGFRCTESLIPPPPPPSGYVMQRGVGQPTQPSGHHWVQHFQPPQQPSVVQKITQSETSSLAVENDPHLVFANPPPPPPSSHSCASPFPPSGVPISDGKELTSADFNAASESPSQRRSSGGCPDPVKANDAETTDDLTHASHNYDSFVTVDGLYNESETRLSMVNVSLRMNSKSELLRPEARSLSLCNSSTGGKLCSASDSDMDMEDDILNLVEDLETNGLRKDQNHENLALAENLDGNLKLHGHTLTQATSTHLPTEGVTRGHFLGQPSSMKTHIEAKQCYESEDSTEKRRANNFEDVSHAQPADDEYAVLKKVREPNLVSDGGSNNHCTAYEESNPVTSEHSLMQKKVTEFGKETEMDLKNSSMTYMSVSKSAEVAKRDGSKEYSCDESQHPSQAKDRLKPDDMTYKHGKSRAEDTTASLQLEVDEFGRLAKNVSSDSDSVDRHYSRKRGRRGRSRSVSPFDRRRKTSLRRRHNRSRSRIHSPLRQRSRSRSPGYRRLSESISCRRRRDKIQTSLCFNFRDGKCHRGSSCRFLHHELDNSGSSHSYKRKRLSEAILGDRGSNFQERSKESLGEKGSHRDDKDESHEAHQLNSTKGVHLDSGRVNDVNDKTDVGQGITVIGCDELDQDDHRVVSYSYKHEDVGGETAHVLEASMPRVALGQNAINLPGGNKYQKSAQTWHPYDAKVLPSLQNSSTSVSSNQSLGANLSAAVPQYDNLQPQKSNISYESLSAQHQSLGTPHLLKDCDPRQDSVQLHSYATMGLGIQSVVAENPSSRVPSSVAGTPFSQATTGHSMPQLHSNLSSMQMSSGLPPPSYPGGCPSYNQCALHNQPPQYNPLPVPLWTSLPPPPPRASIYADTPNANNSTSGSTIPYHFEQNQQSQGTNVVPQSGPYSGHMHFISQYGGNHHYNYHPSVEAHKPPFAMPMQRPGSLFIVNSHPQQTEGLHIERNDQTSIQVVIPSTNQPSTSFVRPPATETVPYGTAFRVSLQSNTILQNTSLNDPRNSVSNDSRILGLPGKIESSTLITSSAKLGMSGFSELEHSRTSAHCSMHVSDRPLASMFSQPLMVGAQGVEAHVLREMSSSHISVQNTGQSFPESGGGQYDPLLDSLDKSPNSLVNSERVKKQRSNSDSDNMPRDNVSRKPLDVEEANRKKESEAIASLTSSDNEEFGETADAEVGPHENESVNNLADIPNRDGEAAISETYPDKKSKDSRSMKLFKSAIANFVKEVLKPSWQQGNMSKEAFKTIVKKTVEKVSGAMKGHRYPKSHAKINHYINSSERKLRKLVMGYVDKYVKL